MAHESQDRSWPKSLRNSAKKKLKKGEGFEASIWAKFVSRVSSIYEPSLFSCFCIVVVIAVVVAMVALFECLYPHSFGSCFHINKETLFSLLSVYATVIFALLIFIIGSRQGLLGTMRVIALLRASYIFPIASTVVLLAACYFLLSSFALNAPLTNYVTLAVLVSWGFFIFWSIYRTVRTVMDPGEFKKMLERVIFDRFRKLQKDYELRALASVEMRSFAEEYDDVIRIYDWGYWENSEASSNENFCTFLENNHRSRLYMTIEDVNLDALNTFLEKLPDFSKKEKQEREWVEKIVWVGGLDDSFGEGDANLYIPKAFIKEANLSLDSLIEGENPVYTLREGRSLKRKSEQFSLEFQEGLISSMKRGNLSDVKFCLDVYYSVLNLYQDKESNSKESSPLIREIPQILDLRHCFIVSIGSKDISIFELFYQWICNLCAVLDKKNKIPDLGALLRRDNWSAVLRAGFESGDSGIVNQLCRVPYVFLMSYLMDSKSESKDQAGCPDFLEIYFWRLVGLPYQVYYDEGARDSFCRKDLLVKQLLSQLNDLRFAIKQENQGLLDRYIELMLQAKTYFLHEAYKNNDIESFRFCLESMDAYKAGSDEELDKYKNKKNNHIFRLGAWLLLQYIKKRESVKTQKDVKLSDGRKIIFETLRDRLLISIESLNDLIELFVDVDKEGKSFWGSLDIRWKLAGVRHYYDRNDPSQFSRYTMIAYFAFAFEMLNKARQAENIDAVIEVPGGSIKEETYRYFIDRYDDFSGVGDAIDKLDKLDMIYQSSSFNAYIQKVQDYIKAS